MSRSVSPNVLTSLRSLGIGLTACGVLALVSPALASGLAQGILVIGLSCFVAFFAGRRRWRYGVLPPLVIGVVLGGYFIKTGVESEGRLVRVRKANAETRTLGSAVSRYATHTGRLPGSLAELTTRAVNAKGESAGPFLDRIPAPPHGWSDYHYTRQSDAGFRICASGDGTAAGSDSRAECP